MTELVMDAPPLVAEDRRQRLLDVATKLFSRKPYDQVTTDELTQAAGVAKGLLFKYFGSKDGLFLEIVQQQAQALRRAMRRRPGLTGRDSLHAATVAWLAYLKDHAAIYLWMLRYGIGTNPQLRQLEMREALHAITLALKDFGIENPDCCTRLPMLAWVGMAEATTLRWLDLGDDDPIEAADLIVDGFVWALGRLQR